MTKLSRRGFLSGTGTAVAVSAAAGTGVGAAVGAALTSARYSSGEEKSGGVVLDNRAPDVSITLTAGWIKTAMDDKPVKLRTWNASIPGPRIEARPGDRLQIELVNNLTAFGLVAV